MSKSHLGVLQKALRTLGLPVVATAFFLWHTKLWLLFSAVAPRLVTEPWGAFCGHGLWGGCSGDQSELTIFLWLW